MFLRSSIPLCGTDEWILYVINSVTELVEVWGIRFILEGT